MTKYSIWDIKEELVVWLRNKNIISLSDRGVTTVTDDFNGDGNMTQFQLSQTTLKNVRKVTIGITEQTFGTDYTVDYSNAQVNFTTAPEIGVDNVNIEFDYGNDRIFPDFPQPYLKLNSFPRIAVDIISGNTTEFGIGANTNQSEYIISIVCYDKDQSDVEDMIASIRSNLMDDKKNFYYIPFLTITSMGPLLATPFGQNKIFQRNQDIMGKFIFEQ